jgi:hypothetical protein
MKDDLYSDGGPVPTTPEDFAEEVQVIVLDPRLTSGAAIDVQLGQLAVAYARHVLPGFRLQFGPWPVTVADPMDSLRRVRRQRSRGRTPGGIRLRHGAWTVTA